ncbi:DUF438 domain-containing protein [Trichlorobacter lovleyi]|uniref:DUF438 domain-containing protein n=1 Tax=Trichlorobacter lovleyi TaxID=313985 RepID=UPI00223EE030|nr:PAS domain-containing protein [Trichlorobacter lovleyi]QOX78196.1 DUF438 domain-containing protein [Trichlorobacter lovleyi]
MSELIDNREKRVQELLAVSRGIIQGQDAKQLIEQHREAIENLTPHDMLAMEDRQLQMGITPQVIKQSIEKVIGVFFKSLERYPWERPAPDTFLGHLIQENRALADKLQQVKTVLKRCHGSEESSFPAMRLELLPLFLELRAFESHYVKKENILFPYLEKRWENHRPIAVMWSLHDDIRKKLKGVIAVLERSDSSWQEFNSPMSQYFFLVFGMIQKENLVVYPVATETLAAEDWQAMYQQSFDYPFPFLETPQQKEDGNPLQAGTGAHEGDDFFVSDTGRMNYEQLVLLFNHLPVDITFVDEYDQVRFFNRAKDRFFPRSPAIVERNVKNCHPPESVHIVEKIVSEFKNGNRNEADFRIKMKGRYILIRYVAVRDPDSTYRGVLEISQDITDIVAMTGEKRLLDWA